MSSPQMWRATKHTEAAIAKFREEHAAAGLGEVWVHNIYLANLATEDAEWVPGSEVKGAPALYQFTAGGALTFNY